MRRDLVGHQGKSKASGGGRVRLRLVATTHGFKPPEAKVSAKKSPDLLWKAKSSLGPARRNRLKVADASQSGSTIAERVRKGLNRRPAQVGVFLVLSVGIALMLIISSNSPIAKADSPTAKAHSRMARAAGQGSGYGDHAWARKPSAPVVAPEPSQDSALDLIARIQNGDYESPEEVVTGRALLSFDTDTLYFAAIDLSTLTPYNKYKKWNVRRKAVLAQLDLEGADGFLLLEFIWTHRTWKIEHIEILREKPAEPEGS